MYQAFVERFLYIISFNLTTTIGIHCCGEPTSQMRKLRCRKVKWLTSGHIVYNWQSQELNLNHPPPEPTVLIHKQSCLPVWIWVFGSNFFSLMIYSIRRWGESGTFICCWLVHIFSLRNFGLKSKLKSIVIFRYLACNVLCCCSKYRHITKVKVSGTQVSAQLPCGDPGPSVTGRVGARWLTVEDALLGGKLYLRRLLQLLRIFWWWVLKAAKP